MASAAAKRYARAIFELAQAESDIESWGKRLATVRALLEDPIAHGLLTNPALPRSQRQAAVTALVGEKAGTEARNLALLLVENRRVDDIGAVVEEFEILADAAAGRVRATVTTAVELSAADRTKLESNLKTGLGRDVRLLADVDPGILGGLVLKIGDHLTDASIATRLQQLRRRLAS